MIEIRPVTTIAECRDIEAITEAAWQAGPEISVPDHLTITIAKENGGVVLMAWDSEKPIGFTLGFLSFVGEEKRLKICSHLAAVLPEYRGKQIGEQLKWAQRDYVLAMGIDHITWTYDPLETLNGRLNIHKLGATCKMYQRDVYGDGRDPLNTALPTDRFYVDWWLDSDWVKAHHAKQVVSKSVAGWLADGVLIVNPPKEKAGLWRFGEIVDAAFAGAMLLTAVPRNFQALKQADTQLGLAWRQHTRELFERAFAQNFVVKDLIAEPTLCYYLLERDLNPHA